MFVLHYIMWPVPRSTSAAGPVSFFPKQIGATMPDQRLFIGAQKEGFPYGLI